MAVLLELDRRHAGFTEPPAGDFAEVDVLRRVRERAVLATDLSFSISDPHLPDAPLVWVNEAFTRVTGYAYDEVVGRNCRFLQGPDTDPAAVAQIAAALREQRSISVTLQRGTGRS